MKGNGQGGSKFLPGGGKGGNNSQTPSGGKQPASQTNRSMHTNQSHIGGSKGRQTYTKRLQKRALFYSENLAISISVFSCIPYAMVVLSPRICGFFNKIKSYLRKEKKPICFA